MKSLGFSRIGALLLSSSTLLFGAGVAYADPVASPAFAGPLTPNPEPLTVDGGLFGEITVTGQISGIAVGQTNASNAGGIGNEDVFGDVSNAMIEVQTTSGPVQAYVQAGLYSFPTVGVPYTQAVDATDLLYGAVPVAYLKVVATPQLSVQAGLLPTIIGAEGGFTFQNFNIERGQLWNQEPVVSRGIQVNYASGPVSVVVSLNDGYFSGKFNWLSGLFAYTIDPNNTIAFVAGTAFSETDQVGPATPLAQNNSAIFNIIYTHTAGNLQIIPYIQYQTVGRNEAIGLETSAEAWSGALLLKYAFNPHWSLGARGEYITASAGACAAGNPGCTPTNLLYGPESSVWSATITPTYQQGRFFIRGELSYTRLNDIDVGFGFGENFDERDQFRGVVEAGFLF